MSNVFENDSNDRKRRFLRGLNVILGLNYYALADRDILLRDAVDLGVCGGVLGLRGRLANVYCLEFTKDELIGLFNRGMTAGEFTEKYVETVYRDRGDVDFNSLVGSSMRDVDGTLAIDLAEVDKSPKYGLNGSRWCDVADGPCSCGAWHKQ